jgi:hypothetical protein
VGRNAHTNVDKIISKSKEINLQIKRTTSPAVFKTHQTAAFSSKRPKVAASL